LGVEADELRNLRRRLRCVARFLGHQRYEFHLCLGERADFLANQALLIENARGRHGAIFELFHAGTERQPGFMVCGWTSSLA